MYVSTMKDTLKVDDIDIKSFPGVIINHIDYFSTGERRGSNEVIPGRRGQVGIAKPLDAYTFSATATILPVTANGTKPPTVEGRRGQMIANLRTLTKKLQGFNSGGQVTLSRKLTVGEGAYETTTALGEYVHGTAFSQINWITGKTELEFINLDGCWYSSGTSVITVDDTVKQAVGEYATRRMTITIPGLGTLSNVTAGVSLELIEPCTVNVTNYTVTTPLLTHQANVLKRLSAKGDVSWFVLVPGDNLLTWSGYGSPTITYRSAHF